ncbi:MAG: hypothetical protein IJU36_06110 [Paludibacteraceae bacterium]|nr:hypothetical protein [Paludibacteraceae bacterium]
MKKVIIFYLLLTLSCRMSAQQNYHDLLIREHRTYWATPASLCHSHFNCHQLGVYFDTTGLFDRYEITDDNDTISLYDVLDTEIFVSHRTFTLQQDTIFIIEWLNTSGEGILSEAYKILYLTEQRLVLLKLKPDDYGGWKEELVSGDCDYLMTQEFKYMKP